ncbi:MAG: hypothetical protein ACOZBH_04120 [Patescibacteria group bacterium]
MALFERLAAMKAKQEAADIKKKKEAETAKAEVEKSKLQVERESMLAEMAQAEEAARQAKAALTEAEAFAAEQGENIDPEVKAEIVAIKKEAAEIIEKFENLKAEITQIDQKIAVLSGEVAPVKAPAEGPEPAAEAPAEEPEPAVEAPAEEPKPAVEPAPAVEMPEPTPEDSKKAMNELLPRMITGVHWTKDWIEREGVPINNLVQQNTESNNKAKNLIGTLAAFEGKDPSALSVSERNQLQIALAEAYGATQYTFQTVHRPPYNEKWPTVLDNMNGELTGFVKSNQYELKEMRAELAVLNGEDTPDFVGRVNLANIKEKMGAMTASDKQQLIELLQSRISEGEESIKKAEDTIEANKDQLRQSEPILRNSERTLYNTKLELDKLERKLRRQFKSVL